MVFKRRKVEGKEDMSEGEAEEEQELGEEDEKKDNDKGKVGEGDWAVGEVPEKMRDVIFNKNNDKLVLDEKAALALILNKIDKIEKLLLS